MPNFWPWTNLHELNLDWIIQSIKDQETRLTNFVSLNSIKYADPFQWSITSQYSQNTLVIDPQDGTAYLSIQPVPSGVQITNTEYWTPVFTLQNFTDALKKAITAVPQQENGQAATEELPANSVFFVGDQLCTNPATIQRTSLVVIGSNCVQVSVVDLITDAARKIAAEQAAREQADTALDNKIAAEQAAREQADTALDNKIAAEQAAREQADTQLSKQIADISEKLTGAILTNENTFINAAAAGMPASGDVSTFLNQLMSDHPGACIFIPTGTYQAANTINVTAPVFVCLGTIQSAATVALDIAVNYCRVYVYRVNGQSSTDAVKLSGVEGGRGRCTVNVDYISGCRAGFYLYDNTNGGGVLRNKFAWNYMDNMGVGILLETGAANSFVNQNEFFGGGIEATCAIKMMGSQTDPFNGNVFYNVSFEESTQAVNLQNAERNVFRDFRMFENTAQNSIVLDSKCEHNYFYGACATVWNKNMVNDKGVNFYYGIALKSGETTYSMSFRSAGETIYSTPEQYVDVNKLPAGNPNTLSDFYAIDINNNDVVMPAWFSIDFSRHPVYLNVISVSNNRITLFNGTVIANSNDTSGSSGVKLEAGWYILISPAWLVKLN